MTKEAIKLKVITTKLKTVTNFDNDCEWIYAKNEFMMNDKVYNEWDEMRCETINETIDDNRWDVQD